MTRPTSLLPLFLLLACQGAAHRPGAQNAAGQGGGAGQGGDAGSGGTGGSGGAKVPPKDASGTPDVAATPDTGGAAADASAASPDAVMSVADTGAAPGDARGGDASSVATGGVPLEGRPHIRLCGKDWSQAQCCEFLCACLRERCADAPRAVPGIAGCMNTCMKLDNKTMRCHVYHCYEAKGPDFRDHESHCAHAANTLGGGGCPTPVFN